MFITKYMLIEQIKRRLNGGNPSAPKKFWDEDILLLMGQCINARLKADNLTTTLAMGETIPEGLTMMTYDGDNALPVEQYGYCYSSCTLPCMPVKLMRDMGVFHVSRDKDEANPFIYIQPGLWPYVIKQKLINDLLGQIGYTPNGNKIIFYKDLVAESIDKVMVKLIVADVFSLGDFDPLPITAEMQSDIVEEVFQKLVNKPPQDKRNDVTTVE